MDEDLERPVFVGERGHLGEKLPEDRLVMELGVELAAGLHVLVKGQVDDPLGIGDEELPQLHLVLPDVLVEGDQRGQYLLVADAGVLEPLDLLEDDVDIVGGLDGLVVARVHLVGVLLEHVDIGDEGGPLTRLDYVKRREEGTVISDGSSIKLVRTKGPLANSPMFQEKKVKTGKK